MAKGEIIVEGATCFCSNSVKNNSKANAVPLAVKSQIKKLKANKYFAQEKPIATNLDDTSDSFNNGAGFGDCYLPDKKTKPCKGQCSIKYKDFYKNVDFDKSMKVLLDISTGTCPGYGTPGIIEFATTGQKKAVNTIDVKEADSFTVENTSAQWETADPTKEDSVSEINIIVPVAEKPTGKYYFIEKAKNTNIWPLTMPVAEAKLQLKAIYKGDPTKITWALFKGDEVKDKVKTFVGIGANIVFTLDKLFKDLDEGVYRIEAYANRPGYKDCAILIEYIKDHVEGITTPGSTLLKNTPIPLTLKFKASSLVEKQKILNPASLNPVYETSPIASWRVTCKNVVIFNSQISSESNLIKVETKTGALGIFTFKNPDEYQVEAYTSSNDTSPIKITLKVLESLGVNTVKGTCNQLLRYNESLKVEVSKFNVEFLPTNNTKMQWYLQKDGIRLTAFENAAISKEKSINKPINQILYYDAHGGNNYFGKYAIEGYGKPTNRPLFNASDSFFFEVIRNSIDKVTLPKSIPKGAKVKIETAARIMPLIGGEKINLELPNGVVDNHDGTITFNSEGEFEIAAYLTGEQTLDTRVKTKIKVATPELKRALWSYGTGYKRTETGYKEETHAFVEIVGLENQSITIKVWVRGARESFYLEPATYMLEEKKITLNDKGIGSFKIITDEKYKDKIKKAVPATTEVPNPNISLIFTVEMPTGSQGAIALSGDMAIKNGKPVVGTKFIEVLDSNEELAVTNEKKINPIFFTTEDGKGVQQTLTHQAKTHKIWVHTVNMQEEELRVDVMNLVHSDCMEEKNGIITALQSIQEYKKKVGIDGLLELPFTAEEKYLTDAEVNPVRFSVQVSRKVKDPNDDKKEVYIFEGDQLAVMSHTNASFVRSPDMKTIGIKATKQDKTSFTKEEKIALRKQLICFKNTALIVEKSILTEEAIDNCTVPVVIDSEMAELVKGKSCYCNKDLTEEDLRALVKTINGRETIWGGENCNIDDKSYKSLTFQLNAMFRKYNINECIQKIAFLAMTSVETGFFQTTGEIEGDTNSSQYFYKGRGILQLTGDGRNPVIYSDYQNKIGNAYNIIENPNLVSQKLFLSVDSGGFVWNHIKALKWEPRPKNSKDKDQADYEAKMKAFEWKRNKFAKGLSKNLNDIALLMKENEEDYFFLICRLLQGYAPTSTSDYPATLHLDRRKENLQKIKNWFKFNKNVCDSGGGIPELSGRAPWMDVAIQEIKNYGGKKESLIDSRVRTYHKDGGGDSDAGSATSWCSSFVCWCLENGNHKYLSPHSTGSRFFLTSNTVEKCEAFFGAIAVFSDCNKDGSDIKTAGHVTFVFGKLKDTNNYAVLGGNQGDKITLSPYYYTHGNSFKMYVDDNGVIHYKIFRGFYKPKGYVITEKDQLLATDEYANLVEANKAVNQVAEAISSKGEKSQ
jgi:uncharacterized protein (TIGR02594 family)